MCVGVCEGVAWVDSGLASDTFSCVVGDPPRDAIEATVTHLVARYEARALPMAWWCLGGSEPSALERRLARAGLLHVDVHVAMTRAVDGLPPADLPSGLEVLPVEDVGGLSVFGRVIAGADAPPDAPDQRFYELAAEAGAASELHHRVGRLDGVLVATASIHVAGTIAGIYDVTTRSSYRGRGIGAAMTRAAMHTARTLEIREIALQASAEGLGIYRRLGFADVGQIHTWALRGCDAARGPMT